MTTPNHFFLTLLVGIFVHRLQERLQASDNEAGIMKDWRGKCATLKSNMDVADEKIQGGKNAKSTEDIESCYIMLKVMIGLFSLQY